MRKATLQEQLQVSQASMNIFKGRYETLEHCISKHESQWSNLASEFRKRFDIQDEITNEMNRQITLLARRINKIKKK